jgi:hypothetical protein
VPKRVRRGRAIRVRATLQRVRGAEFKRTYSVRIPGDAKPGRMKLRLTGRDADAGDSGLATTIVLGGGSADDGAGDPGPASLRELADEVRANGRYDGVTLRLGSARARAFRDGDFRISGRAEATVRVVR